MTKNVGIVGRILVPLSAVVLIGWGTAGCGGGKQSPSTDLSKAPWEVRMESPLDTVAVSVPPRDSSEDAAATAEAASPVLETPQVTESQPSSTAAVSSAGASSPPDVPSAKVYMPGWRVQLNAFLSMANAEAFAGKARQHFTEPVYVEYEPPLYKVRVGDFLSREDARHMANRAKAEDFEKAWVVEALVLRPQR
jgi:cell division septation protein DedD